MNLCGSAAFGFVAFLVASGASARAADLPSPQAPPVFVAPAAFTWTGAYVGAFLGGGSGVADFHDPRGHSIYGDGVPTPFVEGGGQIGYNAQAPASRWVLGVEADGGAVGLNGQNTCIAPQGFFTPFNCRVAGKAMATGTARIGYALGADGHTLAYLKGGVAGLFAERDITSMNSLRLGGPFAVYSQAPRAGFTVGAGLEQALSNAWSLKIEYDYADFGSAPIGYPQSLVESHFVHSTTAPGMTSERQSLHELKVGLNYHLGAAPDGGLFAADLLGGGSSLETTTMPGLTPYAFSPGYVAEAGARYWYSFGSFQRGIGQVGQPNGSLISRLTYQSEANSGEVFARIDTPSRLFVKGFVGAGGVAGGHQNDEDFDAQINANTPYSNTISSRLTGTLAYATVDLGYAFLKTAHTNVGGFVGYNYDRDDKAAYGCQQFANPNGACSPGRPPPTPFFQQNERYDSVRVGLNGDMWLGRFRIDADAAYLPFVGFNGTDVHLQRFDVLNQTSPEFGRGQGVQLELIASCYLTPNFSVGAGGRFWSMWVPNAQVFDFGQSLNPGPIHSERYGVTAQAAYRFSSFTPGPVVARD